MWYSTSFTWSLKFNDNITVKELSLVKSFLWEDYRDHPEWGSLDLSYIDLQLSDDLSWIEWDWSEKTYDLDKKIDLIISKVREVYPEFSLSWSMLAQWEDVWDVWNLSIWPNWYTMVNSIALPWDQITCPMCQHKFYNL